MPRHRAAPVFLVALAVAVALSGCRGQSDWIQFRGEQGSGATPNALYPPLAARWKLKLQAEGQKATAFNNPVVLDETIYFGSSDGNFYALDILTGYMRWFFKTGGAINSVPFADEDKVYFGSNDGSAYALWRDSGRLAWSYPTRSTVQSTVIGYEDNIIVISDVDAVYVLSRDGALVHTVRNPIWSNFSFQVYDDVMYFAPGPRAESFGAYDLTTRQYLFALDNARFEAQWYSFPAIRAGRVYFGTVDPGRGLDWLFNYYAFDKNTGQMLWQYTDFAQWGVHPPARPYDHWYRNLDLLDYQAPALWRNLVIYTSGDSLVRAFDGRTGRLAWTRAMEYPVSAAPAVAGNRVYFGMGGDLGRRPRLVALSASNGRTLWEMETEGELLSSPLIAGKYMIFGTDEHVFYVLEEVL